MAFTHEDEIQAAYDVAETVLRVHIERIVDPRPGFFSRTDIRAMARAVADAVIRTTVSESGDITDLNVDVERNEHAN